MHNGSQGGCLLAVQALLCILQLHTCACAYVCTAPASTWLPTTCSLGSAFFNVHTCEHSICHMCVQCQQNEGNDSDAPQTGSAPSSPQLLFSLVHPSQPFSYTAMFLDALHQLSGQACICVLCLHKCAHHLPALGCHTPAPWDVSFYLSFKVTISVHNTCQHLAALHLLPELCLHLCAVPA